MHHTFQAEALESRPVEGLRSQSFGGVEAAEKVMSEAANLRSVHVSIGKDVNFRTN